MAVLIALASLIPILITGDAVLAILSPERNRPLAERFGLALTLGSGFATLVLFCASMFDSHLGIALTMGPVAMLIAVRLLGRRGTFGSNWGFALDRGKTALNLLLTFPFCLGLAILSVVSLSTDLGFDGLVTWGFKAKLAFLQGGWTLDYFTDPLRQVTHQDYPLLVPSLEAWVYTFLGRVDEQAAKVIFLLFFFALLALFYHAMRSEFSSLLSLGYTVLLASTPYLASLAAISGYADVPLMVYVFGAAVSLQKWIKRGARSDLVLGGVLSGLAVWLKREGIVYWSINLVAVLVNLTLSRHRLGVNLAARSLLAFVAPAVVISGPWFVFLSWNRVSNSDFLTPSLEGLFANLDRLPVIAAHLLGQLAGLGQWGILWLLFFGVSVFRWRKLGAFANSYIWISTVGAILLLSFAFVFSVWEPFTEHLDLALDRLVLQPAPLAWYFIALQVPELEPWLLKTVRSAMPQARSEAES